MMVFSIAMLVLHGSKFEKKNIRLEKKSFEKLFAVLVG